MCDLDQPDGYGVAFADKVIKSARVEHRCEECRKLIKVGATYTIISGTWDSDFFAIKICRRCAAAMRWLNKRGHGWSGGEVLEDVRYCVEQELLEAKAAAE